ncbi:MAG: helix-turn-helix transcriptional regulator [Clostridia bacterium]|nr:helix-turn-helix transcriptional regulator [Clostridia bacterium]
MQKESCAHNHAHEAVVARAKEEILLPSDVEKVCKIFQLLSDPSRLKIVLALLNGELCVYHLTEVCEGTQSAVSHQLRILRDNHIVKSRRQGKFVEYSIADNHVRGIIEMGVQHLQCAEH